MNAAVTPGDPELIPVHLPRSRVAGVVLPVAGPIEVEERAPNGSAGQLEAVDAQQAPAPRRLAAKSKPERAARGVVREAILAALEHGSHTVGELAVVTAMTGPSINGNLRRLVADGAVVKTEREGKAAWVLADAIA